MGQDGISGLDPAEVVRYQLVKLNRLLAFNRAMFRMNVKLLAHATGRDEEAVYEEMAVLYDTLLAEERAALDELLRSGRDDQPPYAGEPKD